MGFNALEPLSGQYYQSGPTSQATTSCHFQIEITQALEWKLLGPLKLKGEMPEAYWEFLNRPLGKHTSVFDASTTLYRDTILSTAAFSALFILTPIVSNIFFPKWYNNMDKKRKFDFKSYFVCLFHHCYVVPVSWYHIYLDYIAPKSQYNLISYAHSEIFFIPFCLGYLLSGTA